MNLPKVVAELIKAQNDFDSLAYANCFTETAIVLDEGHDTLRQKRNRALDRGRQQAISGNNATT